MTHDMWKCVMKMYPLTMHIATSTTQRVAQFFEAWRRELNTVGESSSQSSVAPPSVSITRRFECKDLACIIMPTQGYLNVLDPRRDKTAVQLYDEMAKDRDLFIKVFCLNKPYAQTERLLQTESLDDILELSKRFRLLVGGSTAWLCVFSDLIRFQCNCPLFWGRCAYKHALYAPGLHLSLASIELPDGVGGAIPRLR